MLTCSFCAFYDAIDGADRVVVINGHSACLKHAKMLWDDGTWLVALSQITPPEEPPPPKPRTKARYRK